MDTATANEFPPAAGLPAERAPSAARKSPPAARWRQHADGDADADGAAKCRLLQDRRHANKLAGLV